MGIPRISDIEYILKVIVTSEKEIIKTDFIYYTAKTAKKQVFRRYTKNGNDRRFAETSVVLCLFYCPYQPFDAESDAMGFSAFFFRSIKPQTNFFQTNTPHTAIAAQTSASAMYMSSSQSGSL